ncbi:MAG: septum formation protein Maf, partial [Acidobacteria bacterium RIFCSPLOWO2_12_FULL_54_10]
LPEIPLAAETPEAFVCRMAEAKAHVVLARQPSLRFPILAADTVVVLGNSILGKPSSPEDARRMLRELSGNLHTVLTAVCLLCPPDQHTDSAYEVSKDIRVASTEVKFLPMTQQEIEDYVATGEPLDKAGAYAIQGFASKYIAWIHGDYFNVVGLPISLVWQMLKR